MSIYDHTCEIGIAGLNDILPFLKANSYQGRFVLTNKGQLAEFLQAEVGDALLNTDPDQVLGAELKTEAADVHGNVFAEAWSNLNFWPRKLGWMYTLHTDILLYYFLDSKELYSIPFKRFWEWCFIQGNFYRFPERLQKRHQQKNKTYGRCIPIKVIEREVGFRKYIITDSGFTEAAPVGAGAA